MGKEGLPRQGEDKRVSQLEDRVLKTAAQFFGEDLLPYVGVKGMIDRVAPTEHIHLEMRRLEEDFNFIMKDGSWRHLEFESDSITQRDLRRFREYEAFIGMVYNVPVVTTVLCTSNVKILKGELDIREPGIKRMQSVLYALAVKFLKREELEKVKERIGMTILGQMLWEEGMETGLEKGMAKGMAKGIQALILDNMEEGIPRGRIIEKLCRRFSLSEEVAIAYYEKYAAHDNR